MEKTNALYFSEVIKDPPISYVSLWNAEKDYLRKIISKGTIVLSVACGEGREISYILDIAKEIIGLDHDKEIVKTAKFNFKNNKNVEILLADAKRIPFKDGFFYYVISMGGITNFGRSKIKILNEMSRVLKPNGQIILSCYSEDAFDERMKIYKQLDPSLSTIKKITDDGTVIFDKSLVDNISEQFTEEKLINLFSSLQLKINKIIKTGIGYICDLSKDIQYDK